MSKAFGGCKRAPPIAARTTRYIRFNIWSSTATGSHCLQKPHCSPISCHVGFSSILRQETHPFNALNHADIIWIFVQKSANIINEI
jgi:hypothetical protein